jgi:ubiquinone/menaquinone biosynthesis C-methylase UbiE
MDAAVHRLEEAQSGEPVKGAANLEREIATAGGNDLPSDGGSRTIPVAEGYERWAPSYDHVPNPLLACEERYLSPLLADLRAQRILDLACGTGRWLQRLIKQGRWGVGIDCSPAMLRVAATKSLITGHLARAACERLPFRTAVFDLAICSFAIGHIQDLRLMARELARVTKPGADVFVSDLHPEAFARGWRVGFRDETSAFQIEMRPRTAEEAIRTFDANGFDCLTSVSLSLGEPGKPILARAGKDHSFAEACQVPAILVCHFKAYTTRLADRWTKSVKRTSTIDRVIRPSIERLAEVRP